MFIPANVDLKGDWEGCYRFGDDYPENNRRLVVGFTAKLTVKGAQIEGTVKEDKNGIPEIATLDGAINRVKIMFVKTYKKSYTIDEHNNKTSTDNGPYYVNYSGFYNPLRRRFIGTWYIHGTYHFKDGSTKERISTGTWDMKRKTYDRNTRL
jgi:hypothetical protein